MMAEGYVLLSELADEWGIDKSNARKYVWKCGFSFVRVRGDERTHQLVLALTVADAEIVREMRLSEGYTTRGTEGTRPVENGAGTFYLVQIIPDVDQRRVKLGYAMDAERRLSAYRTVSPTATIVHAWPCSVSWERAAIASLTAEGCTLLGGEVYLCEDIDRLVQRGDTFFACMPEIGR